MIKTSINKITELCCSFCLVRKQCNKENCTPLNQAKQQLEQWALENVVIDKEKFRSVICEFTPSIAEDSNQPEWCQSELDKCYDELMARNPIILKQRGGER